MIVASSIYDAGICSRSKEVSRTQHGRARVHTDGCRPRRQPDLHRRTPGNFSWSIVEIKHMLICLLPVMLDRTSQGSNPADTSTKTHQGEGT
jgi:hypothetical protein